MPQFYLRRFACPDDPNKVDAIEQHRDVMVGDRKSIDRIAYEAGLHHVGLSMSVEAELNRGFETPFASGPTWAKILNGACGSLGAEDALPIYRFARHLYRRNLEMLRFIEREHALFAAGQVGAVTDDEREMHEWIAASRDGPRRLFLQGALADEPPADAGDINVMVCRTSRSFRTSTAPTLVFSHPGEPSIFGEMFSSFRTWWITLDRHCGAFVVAGGPPGFGNHDVLDDLVRVINRQYLVQHQNALSVRYLVADDEHVADDLAWAGYRFEQRTTHGFRYRKKATIAEQDLT